MSVPLDLLSLAALVGAFDVLYYHLYRFRLYRQPGSVAEEATHLVRAAAFVGFAGGLAVGPAARPAMIALMTVDLANSIADVLLERRSRAPLGGLPTGEYLVHVLGSTLVGAAAAAYLLGDPAPLEGLDVLRAAGTAVLGAAMWVLESALFAHALVTARRSGPPREAAGNLA